MWSVDNHEKAEEPHCPCANPSEMADLKAKAADIADKALARLYFVVGAIIGIFTGVLSAIPHLPQIVEGLWGKAKDAKVRILRYFPCFGSLRLGCSSLLSEVE